LQGVPVELRFFGGDGVGQRMVVLRLVRVVELWKRRVVVVGFASFDDEPWWLHPQTPANVVPGF